MSKLADTLAKSRGGRSAKKWTSATHSERGSCGSEEVTSS